MKSTIFLYLGSCMFMLWASLLSAQEYQPMAVEGAHWIIGANFESSPWIDDMFSLTIKGDTLINGKNYKKVYKEQFLFDNLRKVFPRPYQIVSNELVAFLRDEIATEKVYCIKIASACSPSMHCPTPLPVHCPIDEEFLLFDFSVQQTDTLDWCNFSSFEVNDFKFVVDSVSTVVYNDIFRKAFFPSVEPYSYLFGPLVGIQGIGFQYRGPFLEWFHFLEKYCIGSNENCDILSPALSVSKHQIKIYPNPTSQVLILENLPGSGVLSLSLSDIFGKRVLKRVVSPGHREFRLDLHTYPSGIYMLTIEKDGLFIQQNKIIKL